MKKTVFRPWFRKTKKIVPALGKIFLFLPVPVVFLLFYFLLKSDFFAIRYVECKAGEKICTPETEKSFLTLIGQNIWTINIDKEQERIKNSSFVFNEVEISKVWPNKLKLDIFLRKPVGRVSFDKKDYFVFSDDGMIISRQEEFDRVLPLVIVYEKFPLNLGVQANELAGAAGLFTALTVYGINGSGYNLHEDGYLSIRLPDQSEVIFSLEKDMEKQVASLQLILSRSKIEGKPFSKLDLRFDKPVAVFKQ